MISPHPESNGLGIVDLPEDGSGAFEAPIFYLGLFDTFAVSSTKKSPASGLGREQTATASTFEIRSAFSRWQYGAARIKAGRKTMELRHQRNSVAVARSCISPRAAKRLGIKQPALSLQIRQLKREMSTPLFRRETRGVKVTESGALLPDKARRILDQVERTKAG